jgi:hypothetical protein
MNLQALIDPTMCLFHQDRPWLQQASVFVATLFLLLFIFAANPVIVNAQDDDEDEEQESEFSARGFNVMRIEQEDKITVPPDQAEAVWEFLHEHLIKDTTALKQLDPNFTSFYYVEDFTDTYYDTPELQMLAMQHGVRHRRRKNLTNPNDRKSGRELMQLKLNNITDNPLDRGELKYTIEYPAKIKNAEDQHPLLGIVKPSHREDLKQQLVKLGVDPHAMRPILTIRDLRKRIYILHNKKSFMSISLDFAASEMMWAKFKVVEIEPELNEVAYTEADSATRARMEAIGAKISETLMAKFPDLKRELTPKYGKAFNAFEAQIPFLRFLVKMNMNTMDSVAGIALLGIAIVTGGGIVVKRTLSGKKAIDREAS